MTLLHPRSTHGWFFRATALLVLLAGAAAPAAPLAHAPVETANPLKGFLPFAGERGAVVLSHSMEFFYLPLEDLMPGPKQFRWEPLEARLDAIAGRGRQAVFRVYLDYPKKPSGVPDFLRDGPDGIAGTGDDLDMRRYDDHGNAGVSRSPDYRNAALRDALRQFIAALGARYDGDPRIGFLQLGLLGFWGEWHTFPHQDWFPPPAIQEEILGAFDRAFDRTRLLVRSPKSERFRRYAVGYHDDSFTFSSLAPPAWHFGGRLAASGEGRRWRTEVIGGEIRPENQPRMWEDPALVPEGQDFARCVAALHPSWMLAHGAFSQRLSPAARRRAGRQSRWLGYEFHVPSATIEPGTAERPVMISVTLRNTGVAPFYYDWPLELGILGAGGRIVHRVRPGWVLTGLLPGDPDRSWSAGITPGRLDRGGHPVLLRVVNPLPGGMPLRFANETQDADVEGWLTLGRLEVK